MGQMEQMPDNDPVIRRRKTESGETIETRIENKGQNAASASTEKVVPLEKKRKEKWEDKIKKKVASFKTRKTEERKNQPAYYEIKNNTKEKLDALFSKK